MSIKIKAQSVLESVIAIAIIAVCLFITLLIFSNLYKSKASFSANTNSNKAQSLFYELQQKNTTSNNKISTINEEIITTDLKKIEVEFYNNQGIKVKQEFYIPIYE